MNELKKCKLVSFENGTQCMVISDNLTAISVSVDDTKVIKEDVMELKQADIDRINSKRKSHIVTVNNNELEFTLKPKDSGKDK